MSARIMHEESSSDSITTNGEYNKYAVFVNHQPDFILKLTLNEAESSQIRHVELSTIFDEEQSKASYGKLLDRIVAAVGYEINTKSLKLAYRDFENDDVVVSSTQELTHAIQQCFDKGIIKFSGNVEPETQVSSRALRPVTVSLPTSPHALDPNIPKDLLYQVHFPTIRFDPFRSTSGLGLDKDNRRVRPTDRKAWKCIYSTVGFTSGCKYWSFRIMNKPVQGHSKGHIMIGVNDGTLRPEQSSYNGMTSSSRCSLYLRNGSICYNGTYKAATNASLVKEATIVGVLLNMDHKTVTFYVDGQRVEGDICGNVLTAREYFPVVSLHGAGSSVEIMDLAQPTHH